MLKSSRVHDCINYTFQILNLGIIRLRVAMAMINGYHFEVITYPQLHQLYLSNSWLRYHEVENCYGYDQWVSCLNRHVCHVLTTTSAIPIKFSTSVSWGWELLWLLSLVIMSESSRSSRIHNYISYTFQILNLGIMRLRIAMAMVNGYHVERLSRLSHTHNYISHTYQSLSLGIMRWRIAMAMSEGFYFEFNMFQNYISYTNQILDFGIMRLRLSMAMMTEDYHCEVIMCSQLHQLYLSSSEPRYHEVANCFGFDQWLSRFCITYPQLHQLYLSNSQPRHHGTCFGYDQWFSVIMFESSRSSRTHNYTSFTYQNFNLALMRLKIAMAMINACRVEVITYPQHMSSTYQILNLGIMRLRIAVARINEYQVEVITYSQLHQLYLSNSQPRAHEVENGYGYDQWLSYWSHHVFTTTSAIPITFSTSVSWGGELPWLCLKVITVKSSCVHKLHQLYLSSSEPRYHEVANCFGFDQWLSRFCITYPQLHQLYLSNSQPRHHGTCFGYDQWFSVIMFESSRSSRTHNYTSFTYQNFNLALMRLKIAMAMINAYHVEVITYPQLHELYLPNSQPRYHEVDNCYGYDHWLSCWSHRNIHS